MENSEPHAPATIPCRTCGRVMTRVELVPETEDGPAMDVYHCTPPCSHRAVVVLDLAAGAKEETVGFVEREIARRGAFFPADFVRSGIRR